MFWYESSTASSVVVWGREEAGGTCEAQVGLAFGCCGVRGGVAAGGKGKGKGALVGWVMLSENKWVPVRVSAVLPARV